MSAGQELQEISPSPKIPNIGQAWKGLIKVEGSRRGPCLTVRTPAKDAAARPLN